MIANSMPDNALVPIVAAFFATFADFFDILLAMAFTPMRRGLNGGACLAFYCPVSVAWRLVGAVGGRLAPSPPSCAAAR